MPVTKKQKKTRDQKGQFKTKYKEINNKKKCSVCKKLLTIDNFSFLNKDNPNSIHRVGLRTARCKVCFNSYRKEVWRKKPQNKKKEKEYNEKNKEKFKDYKKQYKIKNKDKNNLTTRKRAKIRRETDKAFKIRSNLSRRINHALNNNFKNKKIKKSSKTLTLLGCTLEKFITHLEKKFKKGMNWKNYGKWEIDHIIPCAKFILEDPDQQKKCFNFKNLQPLWKIDNRIKSDKL